jgi:hypothetical protein
MMGTKRDNLCNLFVLYVFIIHITVTYAVFKCEKIKKENNKSNNNFLHSGPYAHISFSRCRLSSLLSVELLIHIRTKRNKKLLALIVMLTDFFFHGPHSHIYPAAACNWGLKQQQHFASYNTGCKTSKPARA